MGEERRSPRADSSDEDRGLRICLRREGLGGDSIPLRIRVKSADGTLLDGEEIAGAARVVGGKGDERSPRDCGLASKNGPIGWAGFVTGPGGPRDWAGAEGGLTCNWEEEDGLIDGPKPKTEITKVGGTGSNSTGPKREGWETGLGLSAGPTVNEDLEDFKDFEEGLDWPLSEFEVGPEKRAWAGEE